MGRRYGESGSYKFSYRDDFGHRVIKQFKPNGDTWDEVLPFFMEFLRAVGYVFDAEDDLIIVDKEGRVCNNRGVTTYINALQFDEEESRGSIAEALTHLEGDD